MITQQQPRLGAGADLDVPLVQWPEEEARRQALAERGRPRLLVLAEDHPPPVVHDPLEDWVRDRAGALEIGARQDTLRRRALQARAPAVDEDGVLWVDGRWLSLPESQVSIVEILLLRRGRLVSTDELRRAYARRGGSTDEVAFKAVMPRVARRLAEVGLQVHTVRGRGALLDLTVARRPE
jgi:DNA-binding response OmpR family regulator